MCGIAGIYSYGKNASEVDVRELRNIRDYMTRRGPDGCGEWISPDRRIALAHRRLSIIDLTDKAAQPMVYNNGEVVITYNGEIYNYPELRGELATKGCTFNSNSDTEVIVNLYLHYGVSMLDRLQGMFAFSLWDARKKSMLVARDTYGIKPLYICDEDGCFRIASQVKALLGDEKQTKDLDPAGIAGFYLYGTVPEPLTIYKSIRSLPAGCYQWVNENGPGEIERYQSISGAWLETRHAIEGFPEQDVRRIVREAVQESVGRHMLADVPVGVFLSGGIDSGVMAGMMRQSSAADIKAVTLGFDEYKNNALDERSYAALTARNYGLSYHERVVTEEEFRGDLDCIISDMDQPSIDGINTWFVSKAASELGLKVVVSGIGGDELFGGYSSFRHVPLLSRLVSLLNRVPLLTGAVSDVADMLGKSWDGAHPKLRGLMKYGASIQDAWFLKRALFLPEELPALMGEDMAHTGLKTLMKTMVKDLELNEEAKKIPAFAMISVLESTGYLRNQLLRDADWSGMSHSLEIRTPLVDMALLKTISPYLSTTCHGNCKSLLAASPEKSLPQQIIQRPKTGFMTPLVDWQKNIYSGVEGNGKCKPMDEPWARTWARIISQKFGMIDYQYG